jgi:hypothetical protein
VDRSLLRAAGVRRPGIRRHDEDLASEGRREHRPVQSQRERVEGLTVRLEGGDSNSKPSSDVDVTKFRASANRKGNRREPKKSRIQGEHILSSTDAFNRAEWGAKLGLIPPLRILKGLGVSNPPLSAKQSVVLP